MLKKLQLCLIILSIQCGVIIHAHPINALVSTYFLPRDKAEMPGLLDNLFNNTRYQLWMASYWITNKDVINRLIELKNKHIDVKLILDESCPSNHELIDQFIKNGISPLINPKNKLNEKMHNKFFIVDEKKVWTGSANFTRMAIDPNSIASNYENINIMESEEKAQEYIVEFCEITNDILGEYLYIIANNDQEVLPNWLYKVCNAYFHNYPQSTCVLTDYFDTCDDKNKDRLSQFFPTRELSAIRLTDISQTPAVKDNLSQLVEPAPWRVSHPVESTSWPESGLKECNTPTKNLSRLKDKNHIEPHEKNFKPYHSKK